MALRIGKAFGTSMDMLLRMGAWYDSRAMRRRADEIDVKRYGPVQQARREGHGERQLQRITAGELDERRFMDDEGNILDPLVTPFVLMPDPGACGSGRPCRLWIVTKGALGYCPTEVEMASWDEAERACDAANARMGWTPEEVDRIILYSMAGGTA